MKKILSLCLLGLFVALVTARNEGYIGHKVYKITFQNEEQQEKLHVLTEEGLDFWRKPSWKHGVSGLAMVAPSKISWLEDQLQEMEVAKDVVIEDVYQYLSDNENNMVNTYRTTSRAFDYQGYYRYSEIIDHLEALENSTSNAAINIEIVNYGKTDEDRDLTYIKISDGTNTKPVIVIEAGINPREWITVSAALYAVDQVLENETYLENFDWIVIPVVNPDGYEYTHTDQRLWSKSMSTKSNLGFICPGVNIDRNFDVDWLFSGSSSSPCSHIYAGVEPFSESETNMIRSILLEYGSRVSLYISLQNTGNFISYPWNYAYAATGMFKQHYFLGLDMAAAMNSNFVSDIGSNILGERTSGTSADFAQQNGVLYSFIVNAAQNAESSVLIPENDIVSTVDDVWKAVEVAVNNLIN